MDKTNKNLRGIREDASMSTRFLRTIEAQRRKNKYVLCAIYCLVICLLIFLLYWKFGEYWQDGPKEEADVKVEYR